MRIEAVELLALPNAPESLVGLTIEEARRRRAARMLAAAGVH